MSVKDKHISDLIEAYQECRKMLRESQKLVEETARLLEHLNARQLDYPRAARVNYTESDDKKPDIPLAQFVRLITATKK